MRLLFCNLWQCGSNSVVEVHRWWVLKINTLKGNPFILRMQQSRNDSLLKIGQVFQNLLSSKNNFNKKCVFKLLFSIEKKRMIQVILDIENESQIWDFLMNCHSLYVFTKKIQYCSLSKLIFCLKSCFLFTRHHWRNSITVLPWRWLSFKVTRQFG